MFEEGFAAMSELLESERTGPAEPRSIQLEAADGAALLAEWLAELAYLAESSGFVPKRLAELEVRERALSARVDGFRGEPPHLVKGATYHRLTFEPANDGWRATVVLDV